MSWIRVIYRNGVVIDLESPGDFTVTRGRLEGDLRGIEWAKGTQPRPLHAGIDEIVAIWDYGDREPPT